MSITDKYIVKNDGRREKFDPEKIHDKVILACEGITGVSVSEIELNANIQITNGTKTSDIQKVLIKSAADLISEENPNYEKVAARLLNQLLRKEVYKQYTPLPFKDEIYKRIKKGYYDDILLKYYSDEEIEFFGRKIRYSKDENFTYAGLKQLYEKYLIKRYGQVIETPQEVYMLVNMYMFMKYPKDIRKKWIIEGYKALSDFEVTLPTPIMVGLRSKYRRTISCNGISTGDDVYSIANALKAIPIMTASRSGIGLGTGMVRGLGADIDKGRVKHTGIVPILKAFEASTSMFTQESRGGSSTSFVPFFHIEIEHYLVLKNNKGTDENRVRHMDHTLQVNKLFYERYLNNEDITLFYMNDVPGLYESMGNNDKFEELYKYYENSIPKKRQKKVSAVELFEAFKTERFETGRVYLMNMDHSNRHGNFLVPIMQSNLCTEITLPSMPLYRYFEKEVKIRKEDFEKYKETRRIEDPSAYDMFAFVRENENKDCDKYEYLVEKFTKDNPYQSKKWEFYNGEIFVCILAAIQVGFIKKERIPTVMEYIVRFLEELIDYQEYALPEIEYAAKKRRALGIGVSDLFHYLAKNKVFYNTVEGRNLVHELMEDITYWAYKASVEIAKEKGPCDLFNQTKMSKGILPIDTYKKSIDELVTTDLKNDWDSLRKDIEQYGIRHSTLIAHAPTSNSSRVASATPGVEPPRFLLNIKEDKKVIIKQLVPEFSRLKNYYTTAWGEDFNNIDYFKMLGVITKFTDQAISANQYADLSKYENNLYPDEQYTLELLTAYKYGLKTLYYLNTRTSNNKDNVNFDNDDACAGGGCVI